MTWYTTFILSVKMRKYLKASIKRAKHHCYQIYSIAEGIIKKKREHIDNKR